MKYAFNPATLALPLLANGLPILNLDDTLGAIYLGKQHITVPLHRSADEQILCRELGGRNVREIAGVLGTHVIDELPASVCTRSRPCRFTCTSKDLALGTALSCAC